MLSLTSSARLTSKWMGSDLRLLCKKVKKSAIVTRENVCNLDGSIVMEDLDNKNPFKDTTKKKKKKRK
jgi:hypothetical protein